MPAPLTVIIPTLNDADRLPGMADALLEGVGDGLIAEMILSDGGSTDGTATIAAELGARFLEGPPGQGAQMMRGAAVARAEWLLFVPSSVILPVGWPRAVLSHINRTQQAAGYVAMPGASRLTALRNRLPRRAPVAHALLLPAVSLPLTDALPTLPAPVGQTLERALNMAVLPL